MTQRGTAGYGIGPSGPYGSGPDESESSSMLEKLRPYTDKIEDLLDTISGPIKP